MSVAWIIKNAGKLLMDEKEKGMRNCKSAKIKYCLQVKNNYYFLMSSEFSREKTKGKTIMTYRRHEHQMTKAMTDTDTNQHT